VKNLMGETPSEKVVVVTSLYDHPELLPHFLAHYQRLGATQVIVSVRNAEILNHAEHTCGSWPFAACTYTVSQRFADSDKRLVELGLLDQFGVGQNDWVSHADVDEFHEYPRALAEIIRNMNTHNDWALRGWVVDRLAENGELRTVFPQPNIFEQFPYSGNVTRFIGASTQKIMLARRRVRLAGWCAHDTENAYYDRVPFAGEYIVWHFKWIAGLVERLQARMVRDQFAGCYQHECQTAIGYILANDGRIADNPTIQMQRRPMFWPDNVTKPIALYVPSRCRPQRLAQLLESWRRTTAGLSDIYVGLDADDEANYPRQPGVSYCIGLTERVGPKTNRDIVPLADKYKLIAWIGDDCLIRTPGFEHLMLDGMAAMDGAGVLYGDDLYQRERLCTHPIVSSSIIRALGWFFCPGIEHFYADNMWMDIGNGIGRLRYEPRLVIEHMHWQAGKAPKDAVYESVDRGVQWNRDAIGYEQYRRGRLATDLQRLRVALDCVSKE